MPLQPISMQIQPRQRRDPLDQAAKAIQLRDAIDMGRYRQAQIDKIEREAANEEELGTLFKESGLDVSDPKSREQFLVKAGAIDPAYFTQLSNDFYNMSQEERARVAQRNDMDRQFHDEHAGVLHSIMKRNPGDDKAGVRNQIYTQWAKSAKQRFPWIAEQQPDFGTEFPQDWDTQMAMAQHMPWAIDAGVKEATELRAQEQLAIEKQKAAIEKQNIARYGSANPSNERVDEVDTIERILARDNNSITEASNAEYLAARKEYLESKRTAARGLALQNITGELGGERVNAIFNPDPQATVKYTDPFTGAPMPPEFKPITPVGGQTPVFNEEVLPETWLDVADTAKEAMHPNRHRSFIRNVERKYKNGNIEGVKLEIRQAVFRSEFADTRKMVDGRRDFLKSISDIETALDEYKAAGGNTNILTGTWEQVNRKLGSTSDPKLAKIQARIKNALFNFRRAATGVQFSADEAKQYDQIMPDAGNIEVLNKALISSFKDSVISENNNFWVSRLGEDGAKMVDAYLNPVDGTVASGGGGGAPGGGNTNNRITADQINDNDWGPVVQRRGADGKMHNARQNKKNPKQWVVLD